MNSESVNKTPEQPAGKNSEIAVMIVDDSLVIRGLISRMLKDVPGVSIVASVADGQKAVDKIATTHVDIVILDIEMPVMDGLTALPKLLQVRPGVKVIMASTLTGPNAEASLKALSLGATDYIPKPSSSKDISGVGGSDVFHRDLIAKVEALGRSAGPAIAQVAASADEPATKPAKSLYQRPVSLRPRAKLAFRPKILAVGSSTGGPQALMAFFAALPKDLGLPIVATQHMPPKFTTMLAQHITSKSGFPCAEAEDGMPLQPNRIALAPGDFHLQVTGTPAAPAVRLNQEPPESFCRPAVDPMLRSVVDVYGSRVLAAILTGMGSDGLKGGQVVIDAGGEMIAQDEATSTVWGMPGAVATAGLCTAVLPLDELPAAVVERLSGGMP